MADKNVVAAVDEEEEVMPELSNREKERQALIAKKRKERIPPGVQSANLAYPKRPGFERRVVCDRPGRVEKFERGGWDFVTKENLGGPNPADGKVKAREGLGDVVSQVVGTHKDGSPMTGYLMEIPTELYEEDQEAKMTQLDKLEAGFRQGLGPDGRAGDGQYVPRHTPIQIKHGRK